VHDWDQEAKAGGACALPKRGSINPIFSPILTLRLPWIHVGFKTHEAIQPGKLVLL
jgi:hypothetical protein